MPGVFHEASIDEGGNEFPRFLNRVRTEDPALPSPPPLPRQPWIARGLVLRAGIASAASLAAVALASAAFLATAPSHIAPPVALVEDHDQPRDEVADAVEIVTAFETRLGYAPNLASQLDGQLDAPLDTVAAGAFTATADATTVRTATESADDPVALMILRNLPEKAAFPAGEFGGTGVWVMASGQPDHLVMTPGTDSPAPVITDVEMISRSGQSLGIVQLPLRKSTDAAVAEVATPLKIEANASGSGADEATPLKRRDRLHARKTVKLAHIDVRPKRRIKRGDDALKAKPSDPQAARASDDANGSAGENAPEAKPPGPLTKFFAWLKSGAKKPATEVEQPSALGLAPQE